MKKLASIIAAMSLLPSAAAFGWRAPLRDLPKGISLETASAAEQKGDIARAREDYPSAVAYYQRALRAGGSNADLYNKLGIAESVAEGVRRSAQELSGRHQDRSAQLQRAE